MPLSNNKVDSWRHIESQGCLDLECSPLTHIIEEHSKRRTLNYRELHNHIILGTQILTEQMGKMFISDGICLPHTYRCGKYKWTNTSYIVASCATIKLNKLVKNC